jgi:hypothetical protein
MMGKSANLGQLYDVQSKIKIFKKHWLGLRIYYDRKVVKVRSDK